MVKKFLRLLFVTFALIGLFVVSCTVLVVSFAPDSKDDADAPQRLKVDISVQDDNSVWPRPRKNGEGFDLAQDLSTVNYYIVYDGSGSMKERKCSGTETKETVAKRALLSFSQQIPSDANIGLLAFDKKGVSERLPLGSGNLQQFEEALAASAAGGHTPLKRAITLASARLENQAQRQLGYGEYHLVVVTDGEATRGQRPDTIVNQLVDTTPVVLHTIGFCIGGRHSLNQEGRVLYRSADNPEQLSAGLESVLAESETFAVSRFEAEE